MRMHQHITPIFSAMDGREFKGKFKRNRRHYRMRCYGNWRGTRCAKSSTHILERVQARRKYSPEAEVGPRGQAPLRTRTKYLGPMRIAYRIRKVHRTLDRKSNMVDRECSNHPHATAPYLLRRDITRLIKQNFANPVVEACKCRRRQLLVNTSYLRANIIVQYFWSLEALVDNIHHRLPEGTAPLQHSRPHHCEERRPNCHTNDSEEHRLYDSPERSGEIQTLQCSAALRSGRKRV
jgi:hypothetical protein